jgi:hypothetical protein
MVIEFVTAVCRVSLQCLFKLRNVPFTRVNLTVPEIPTRWWESEDDRFYDESDPD